uniref:Uncharacterized protein n=1 Tax=Oryza punctata TaxID=4537 RepID=A0A0E0MMU3_ORYPU
MSLPMGAAAAGNRLPICRLRRLRGLVNTPTPKSLAGEGHRHQELAPAHRSPVVSSPKTH